MDEQELRNFLGGDYPSDLTCEASPPKLRLDGASIVRFSGFSLYQMTDFLLSPYGLSLSSSS